MTKSKNELQVCTICGRKRVMTYEHIPPKATGNIKPVKRYNLENLLSKQLNIGSDKKPWDFSGIDYEHLQKGNVHRTVCEECNNNGGRWYVPSYSKFIHEITVELSKYTVTSGNTINIKVREVERLSIIKQIISMFLAINPPSAFENSIHDFVLNPESNIFPIEKYSIYMYSFVGSIDKYIPKFRYLTKEGIIFFTEIATYPVGFVMNLGNNTDRIIGHDITEFTKSNYKEITTETLLLPVLESHTAFGLDYRSRSELNTI